MKKINAKFNTKEFSASIFAYFRDYGRNLEDLGFSLTLKEMYPVCDDYEYAA